MSRKTDVGPIGDVPLIVVTVLGGVAEIAENPSSLPILLLDLDEVEAGLRECEKNGHSPTLTAEFLSLDPVAIKYLERAEPNLSARLKSFLPKSPTGYEKC